MGFYLAVDEKDEEPLASNTGWAGARDWMIRLAGEEPRHFATHGWSQKPQDLLVQLQAGIHAARPEQDVVDTVSNMVKLLAGAHTLALITDGFGSTHESDQ